MRAEIFVACAIAEIARSNVYSQDDRSLVPIASDHRAARRLHDRRAPWML
jgi:hypothetical protein